MIIKLTDADINVAQDDETEEGIIKIPDNLWNHIIQAVEHPSQEFVNSLYINVNDLTIGGSGLPIVIYSFQFRSSDDLPDVYDIINTWDMATQTGGSYSLPTNQSLIAISLSNNRYKVQMFANASGSSQTVNFDRNIVTRYYVVTPKSGHSIYRHCIFYNDQNAAVFDVYDASSDTQRSYTYIYSNFIDFLWINN